MTCLLELCLADVWRTARRSQTNSVQLCAGRTAQLAVLAESWSFTRGITLPGKCRSSLRGCVLAQPCVCACHLGHRCCATRVPMGAGHVSC